MYENSNIKNSYRCSLIQPRFSHFKDSYRSRRDRFRRAQGAEDREDEAAEGVVEEGADLGAVADEVVAGLLAVGAAAAGEDSEEEVVVDLSAEAAVEEDSGDEEEEGEVEEAGTVKFLIFNKFYLQRSLYFRKLWIINLLSSR